MIHEGTLKTLKRFKDEVAEVQSGQECGMAFENYDDIRPGDVVITSYSIHYTKLYDDFADRTYIEPITPEMVEKIIARERPDALLPTIGGQTGLNIAVSLHETGVSYNFV